MRLKYLDIRKWIGFILITIALSGCGGGGGGGGTTDPTTPTTTTQTAYFIDSAVSGVNYTCGDINGTTDTTGKFTYDTAKCSAVTFKVGNLFLGSIDPDTINADGKMTVQELAGVTRTDLNNSKVLKIATILQSLDSDGNATNGITLTNTASLSGDINDTNLTPDAIINQFNIANPRIQKTLKTQEQIQTHLVESMVTLGVLDNRPNTFSFTSQTSVEKSSTITSSSVAIGGINTPATVTITNGEYSINGGSWTSSAGTISNAQTIRVRHTSSSSFETNVVTNLTIGGVSGTFTSKTRIADTTPDSFSFTSITNASINTTQTSNEITINGIEATTTISVTNGEYKIGTGNWTSNAGVISNGQTVQVRHTSSTSFNTAKTTTLTIGATTSGTFRSTTMLADTIPDSFSFTSQTNIQKTTLTTSNSVTISGINSPTTISVSGGEYSINSGSWTNSDGTISNGQTIRVRHTSSSSYQTTTRTTLTIGGTNGIKAYFNVTTIAAPNDTNDTVPDIFSFPAQTNVEKNTTITSSPTTISGINVPTSLTIENGEYKIGTGTWTSSNGTISNGQTISVRHTSSLSYLTNTTTTLTIGGISDTFTSTTRDVDTTPNDFSFTSQTNVQKTTTITSNEVNVTGIETSVPVFISGGLYSINGGEWLASEGTISNGQTIKVQHTSSDLFDTNITTTLDIGTLRKTFTSKTRVADTTPNSFSFTSITNASVGTIQTSNEITISGIETATSISILNGEYSPDSGATWISTASSITEGETVKVRHTSSTAFSTAKTTTLTIGGVNGTFTTTTEAIDTTPTAFAFTDQPSVTKNTTATSDSVTITGINAPSTISIVGGYYSINNNDANWTNVTGTIQNNQTVRVRHTTAKISNTETNTTLTIGGVHDTFTTKTDNAYFINYLVSGKPITGVQYSCGSESGTTGTDGSFTYFCSGSDITFKLGSLTLGTINTESVNFDKNITLQGISGLSRDTFTSTKLSKIIWLLSSLDDDQNSSNGITINSKYTDSTSSAKIALSGNIESFTDTQLSDEIIRVGRYPKIKFEAQKEMLETLKSNGATIKDFAVYPETNATNVGPYTLLKIGFGESMLSSTITTSNITLKKGTTAVALSSCSYDDTMKLATCKVPTAGLSESSIYTATLGTGIKNASSTSITAYSFSFTTGTKNIVPKLKTGQTASYNENGEANATLKDDYYYSTTLGTARSLSRNATTGIVTDDGTTLAWIDDSTATSITKNWTEVSTYCTNLTTGSKTWRLPTMKEISLIADKSKGGSTAAIFNTFTNVTHTENTNAYWTSSLDPDDVNLSYAFLFYDGIDQGAAAEHNTSVTLNIRCVSGTPTTSGGFVRDDINQVVMDTSSGLVWQDNETPNLKWSIADETDSVEYCANLTLNNGGWRVPNYNELLSLLEMKNYDKTVSQPVYISPAFKYKAASTYWTSTTYAVNKTKAWTVNFDTTGAISDVNDKIYPSTLRCVKNLGVNTN